MSTPIPQSGNVGNRFFTHEIRVTDDGSAGREFEPVAQVFAGIDESVDGPVSHGVGGKLNVRFKAGNENLPQFFGSDEK